MNNFLSKQTLQIVYAVAILLLLFCAAPILSGPRGFGVSMYLALKGWGSSVMGIYIWLSIIVPIVFILLAVPAVNKKIDSRTNSLIRLIGSGVMVFFMVITLLTFRGMAWGWGLWLIAILTVLLFVNVMLNYKNEISKTKQ